MRFFHRGGADGTALAEVEAATGRVCTPRWPRPDRCGFAPADGRRGALEGIALPGEANRSDDPWPSAAFGDVVRAMGRAMASGGRAEVQGAV